MSFDMPQTDAKSSHTNAVHHDLHQQGYRLLAQHWMDESLHGLLVHQLYCHIYWVGQVNIWHQTQIQYDCDNYGDDLPFWSTLTNQAGETRPHLIIPYTLESNDMKFSSPGGFNSGEQFYQYLKDAFDVLYAEGETEPKMLSIGMHCRILGRPGRFKALQKFLDYVQGHKKVWICRRGDIATHWYKYHAPK